MTHTTEQLAAFSATTAAEQLIIKNAINELMDIRESNQTDENNGKDFLEFMAEGTPQEITQENLDEVAAAVRADSGPAISPATQVAKAAIEKAAIDLGHKLLNEEAARRAEKATMDVVRSSRVFKINSTKVDPVLLALFEDIMSRAVAEKISGVKAVQMVLAAHPQATRIAIKHTAALVGINPLSARNTYDHFKNDKN